MTIKLNAQPRTIVGKKVDQLRQESKIPAVLYGHGTDNINLELDALKFSKVYEEAGSNTIIDLVIEGQEQPVKVLVAEIQEDPVKNTISHVDFKRIKMGEKITAHINLNFIGEAPAVKELSGIFVRNLDELEIKCLPVDLIHEIDVDISNLKTFDDIISVKDLPLPETVEIIGHEPEDVVATVTPQRVEKEEEVVETEEEKSEEKTDEKQEDSKEKSDSENKQEEQKS